MNTHRTGTIRPSSGGPARRAVFGGAAQETPRPAIRRDAVRALDGGNDASIDGSWIGTEMGNGR